MNFERKHIQHLWFSLVAALLALTLVPFSATALTENVLETAPEITAVEVPPEEIPAEENEEAKDSWDDEDPYLPYKEYLPERGTTPEEGQYYNPRLSDSELARYKELLAMLENNEITLDGIPSCANLLEMDENPLRVYSLNPDDFDGETFYVILPWSQKMDDKQLLSLMASFRELGISFDPDSLNERNCTRRAYNGQNRYLSDEEGYRRSSLQYMIVRGMLTKEDAAAVSAGICTEKIPGYGPFYIYPYRSLSDAELIRFLLTEYSAWETSPDLIERTALSAARNILRLPLALSVSDEKVSPDLESGIETVNRYTLSFCPQYDDAYYDDDYNELSLIDIDMLETSGKKLEFRGFWANYYTSYSEAKKAPINDEAILEAAEKWAKENIVLPETQQPLRWSIIDSDNYGATLKAVTDEWRFNLCMNGDLKIQYLTADNRSFLDGTEFFDDEESFVPSDDHPSTRLSFPDSVTSQPLETAFLQSYGPWLTDLELARIRVLMAAMEAGEISYEGPSIVNAPHNNKNGAAVYPLSPEDFDGETFYVILPELQMNDAQLTALISAFKELDIPFDPDSLSSRNCNRMANDLKTRSLSMGELNRYYSVLDRILSGKLTKADLAADVHVMTAEKTNALKVYGSDTSLFCFYPYRKLTDDELALFIFAELERFDTDPAALMSDAIDSAMAIVSLPTSFMYKKAACSEMDIYSKHVKQYTNDFFVEASNWIGTCEPHTLTVKHSQIPGQDPELSGIYIMYAKTNRNDEIPAVSKEDAKQALIAAARQWAEENLKLPGEKSEWILNDNIADYLYGFRVQLQLLTDEWDIRLWIDETSLQPDECYLYSRKWYEVSDEDVAWIRSMLADQDAEDIDHIDSIDPDILKEDYQLSNGFFF